jgi:biopolymer transport protein ExbD
MKNGISFLKTHAAEGVDGTFRPQLTSLIDVMTILLVFLIKSFSVEGNLITPSPDLELPISTSQKPPKPMCSLEITKTKVLSDGEFITDINQFKDNDSLLIPLLYDWMLVQKAKCEDAKRANEVLIQSDRNIEFNVVKRVMFTCSKAGFSDFSVLVLEEE